MFCLITHSKNSNSQSRKKFYTADTGIFMMQRGNLREVEGEGVGKAAKTEPWVNEYQYIRSGCNSYAEMGGKMYGTSI
jgi:hypothetical protein